MSKTRDNFNRFESGRTLHTCNAFERKSFDVHVMRSGDGDMAHGDLLLVHDGTADLDALPDVYERDGDSLTLVEWWN